MCEAHFCFFRKTVLMVSYKKILLTDTARYEKTDAKKAGLVYT